MKTFYLRMRFQAPHIEPAFAGYKWVERTVKVSAPDVLAAAQDAEHIINGYRLGSGLEAECDSVSTRTPREAWLETRADFTGPLKGENDNG